MTTPKYDITKAKGLTSLEYNALIDAIWRLDRSLNESEEGDSKESLKRDRQGLSDLFIRIS